MRIWSGAFRRDYMIRPKKSDETHTHTHTHAREWPVAGIYIRGSWFGTTFPVHYYLFFLFSSDGHLEF